MSYVAVIGDIVNSRKLESGARGEVQVAFVQLMHRLNQEFDESLQGKFIITLGDEFEALVHTSAASQVIPAIIWRIEETFPNPVLRLGIGLGGIDTPITENVTALDGPAFHHAREAIGVAARKKQLGGVFRGFGDHHDAILNGIARVLHHQRSRWSRQQHNLAMILHRGIRRIDAAKAMGLPRQTISAYAKAAGWEAYEEGELAWRKALEESIPASAS
ncbi:MAG TPA: SatD family protein [Acidobacteriaceae bacterium]|jgi:hypothetical protein|nr:SatD family protein [Acidobacteriaceae bacterium]